MEEQGQRVLACLHAALQPETNQAAERQLQQEALQPRYGSILAQIALAREAAAPPVRQLAAVLLKGYVKSHWIEGERGFVPPQAGEDDKAAIKAALPLGLGDADSKIRTAFGMAIAAVANWDGPWCLDALTAAIKGGDADANLGAFGCCLVFVDGGGGGGAHAS